MFFSRLVTSSLFVLGLTSAVVSTPIPQPETQIVKKQLPDLLDTLSGLQATITPILTDITTLAPTGGDITELIGQVGDDFDSVTTVLSGLVGQQIQTDPTQLVTSIVTSVLSTIGQLPVISSAAGSKVDSSVSNFLSILNTLSPGILSTVGSAIPSSLGSDLPLSGILNLLNLNSLVSLLSLTNVLTGLLGGLLGGGLLGGLL